MLGAGIEDRPVVPQLVDVTTQFSVDALRIVEVDDRLNVVDEEFFGIEVGFGGVDDSPRGCL